MSEEHNADESTEQNDTSPSVNRRRFVKALGATGIAASSATFGIGTAAGKKSHSNDEHPFSYEELEEREKKRLIQSFRNTDEYSQLAKKARNNGNHIKQDFGTIRAARGGTPEHKREIVSFELADINAESGHITVGRDITDGEISVALLEYRFVADDGTPQKVKLYNAVNDQIDTQTAENLQVKTVEYEQKVREAKKEARQVDVSQSDSGSTASVPIAPRDPVLTICNECKFAVGEICAIGCGAGLGFICGLLGLGTGGIGAFACIGFVEAACQVIGQFGCGFSGINKKVCKSLDLC